MICDVREDVLINQKEKIRENNKINDSINELKYLIEKDKQKNKSIMWQE